MASIRTRGKCRFCQAEYTKAGMTKHLASCKARPAGTATVNKKGQTARLFDVLVEGRYAPMYWMHLEMPADTTLTVLDDFLRRQWLECCGHLSAFRIKGESYSSVDNSDWGLDDTPMRGKKLSKLLEVGQDFEHEYDFGTTTELKLKVIAEREGTSEKGRSAVQILAQNEPPPIMCDNCHESLATQICSQCVYEGEGWLCQKCAPEHECGEDMLLQVVNPPRTGMCAYEG